MTLRMVQECGVCSRVLKLLLALRMTYPTVDSSKYLPTNTSAVSIKRLATPDDWPTSLAARVPSSTAAPIGFLSPPNCTRLVQILADDKYQILADDKYQILADDNTGRWASWFRAYSLLTPCQVRWRALGVLVVARFRV